MLALVCAGAVSCSEPAAEGPRRAPTGTARHAVHTQRLQSVMNRLGRRVTTDWPQEIADLKAAQAADDERLRFREALRVARALEEAADQIPEAVADADLSDEDRAAFLVIVEQLRGESAGVAAAARAKDLAGMRAALGRVKTTCYGCHAQFREYAGPLQFGRP